MTDSISLYDFLSRVKATLEGSMTSGSWVVAEVSELKVNYSGHCYLELVEKGEAGSQPRAKSSAVMWRNDYMTISSRFEFETKRPLAAGMKILCRVAVTFHQVYGFSLRIVDIDPNYTLGEIERQRQATIEQLRKDGVFDMNRSCLVPEVVQRIAVVSSGSAAGYGDFIQELGGNHYRFSVELFEAVVQGDSAEGSIIRALGAIAQRAEEFDIAVVIRGGGSQSDLSCFNSYSLCYYLAQMPLPVATGIGHDRDESVADLVAAVHLKTPTAVAAWIVEQAARFEQRIDTLDDAMRDMARAMLEQKQRDLTDKAQRLSAVAIGLTRRMEVRLESFSTMLGERARNLLAVQSNKMVMFDKIIEGKDPQRILSLGFAIVRRDGKAMYDASAVESGEKVDITFANGERKAQII